MKIHTTGELRELLEDVPDDTPIRIAFQPSYPLYSESVTAAYIEADNERDDDPHTAFYLGAGNTVEYLGSAAAEELEWR